MGLFSWIFGRKTVGRTSSRAAAGRAEARVRIDSGEFAIRDFGRRTFVATGYNGWLAPGQRFGFTFVLPGARGSVEVPGRGKVLKVGESQLAASYEDPQPYFRKQIDHFVQSQGR